MPNRTSFRICTSGLSASSFCSDYSGSSYCLSFQEDDFVLSHQKLLLLFNDGQSRTWLRRTTALAVLRQWTGSCARARLGDSVAASVDKVLFTVDAAGLTHRPEESRKNTAHIVHGVCLVSP